MVERRQRRLAPDGDDGGISAGNPYLSLAAERVHEAHDAAVGSVEALAAASEAMGYIYMAIAPRLGTLVASDVDGIDRAGWLEALRFLSDGMILKPQLSSLIVALSELNRGVVDARLEPLKSGQGKPTPTDKLYWKAVAVEAFNEMVAEMAAQMGGSSGVVGKVMDRIEDELGISPSTVRDWRAFVKKDAPKEWKGQPAKLKWRVDDAGRRIDPIQAFHFAFIQGSR